jgi:hypothetical protein
MLLAFSLTNEKLDKAARHLGRQKSENFKGLLSVACGVDHVMQGLQSFQEHTSVVSRICKRGSSESHPQNMAETANLSPI